MSNSSIKIFYSHILVQTPIYRRRTPFVSKVIRSESSFYHCPPHDTKFRGHCVSYSSTLQTLQITLIEQCVRIQRKDLK